MLNKKLLTELQAYINKHIETQYVVFEKFIDYIAEELPKKELEAFINNKRKQTFNQVLFAFIDEKSTRDSDVYKRAGIDRRHFSKIRSNTDYRPSKNTVIPLAIALELNKKETDTLLSAAGYSLSDSNTFDLIIQFCLEKNIYDLFTINQALDFFSLTPLAGVVE